VAAVNVLVDTLNEPPFVQLTFGPDAMPPESTALSVEFPVESDSTVSVAGLKDSEGAVVSATGGRGACVDELLPLPPPQADRSSTDVIESAGIRDSLKLVMDYSYSVKSES